MRYRLRTLLILLAVGPVAIATGWREFRRLSARPNPLIDGPPSRVLATKNPPRPFPPSPQVKRIITNSDADGVKLTIEIPEN